MSRREELIQLLQNEVDRLKNRLEKYTTDEYLYNMSEEELFDILPVVFSVGKTWHDDESKRYISEGHYNVIWEHSKLGMININRSDFSDVEETNTYYGSTLKEVLINTIVGEKVLN